MGRTFHHEPPSLGLYLEPELDRRLERAAAEDGVTKAEYIFRAVRPLAAADAFRLLPVDVA